MRKYIPGNRIYTVYRLFPQMNKRIMIVACSNTHARKLITAKFDTSKTESFSIMWNIYDGNHGITTLPLGTVIHLKD